MNAPSQMAAARVLPALLRAPCWWHRVLQSARMFRRRAARLLAGAAGAASAAGACAAGGVLVASSETRLEPSAEPEPDTRPIEILVHNISHSDMLVMLGEDGDENGRTFLARPVFNKFQPVTEAILQQIAALKVRPSRLGLAYAAPHRTMPRRAAAHRGTPRHARRPHPHPHLWQSMGQQPAVVDAPSKYQVPDRRKPAPHPHSHPHPHPHPHPHL